MPLCARDKEQNIFVHIAHDKEYHSVRSFVLGGRPHTVLPRAATSCNSHPFIAKTVSVWPLVVADAETMLLRDEGQAHVK